jgi:hypothetical protein
MLAKNKTMKAIPVHIPAIFDQCEINAIDILNYDINIRIVTCFRPPPPSDTDSEAVLSTSLLISCLEYLSSTDSVILIFPTLTGLVLPPCLFQHPIHPLVRRPLLILLTNMP